MIKSPGLDGHVNVVYEDSPASRTDPIDKKTLVGTCKRQESRRPSSPTPSVASHTALKGPSCEQITKKSTCYGVVFTSTLLALSTVGVTLLVIGGAFVGAGIGKENPSKADLATRAQREAEMRAADEAVATIKRSALEYESQTSDGQISQDLAPSVAALWRSGTKTTDAESSLPNPSSTVVFSTLSAVTQPYWQEGISIGEEPATPSGAESKIYATAYTRALTSARSVVFNKTFDASVLGMRPVVVNSETLKRSHRLRIDVRRTTSSFPSSKVTPPSFELLEYDVFPFANVSVGMNCLFTSCTLESMQNDCSYDYGGIYIPPLSSNNPSTASLQLTDVVCQYSTTSAENIRQEYRPPCGQCVYIGYLTEFCAVLDVIAVTSTTTTTTGAPTTTPTTAIASSSSSNASTTDQEPSNTSTSSTTTTVGTTSTTPTTQTTTAPPKPIVKKNPHLIGCNWPYADPTYTNSSQPPSEEVGSSGAAVHNYMPLSGAAADRFMGRFSVRLLRSDDPVIVANLATDGTRFFPAGLNSAGSADELERIASPRTTPRSAGFILIYVGSGLMALFIVGVLIAALHRGIGRDVRATLSEFKDAVSCRGTENEDTARKNKTSQKSEASRNKNKESGVRCKQPSELGSGNEEDDSNDESNGGTNISSGASQLEERSRVFRAQLSQLRNHKIVPQPKLYGATSANVAINASATRGMESGRGPQLEVNPHASYAQNQEKNDECATSASDNSHNPLNRVNTRRVGTGIEGSLLQSGVSSGQQQQYGALDNGAFSPREDA